MTEFGSRDEVLRWFRARYPIGTDYSEISAQEHCVPDSGCFLTTLPAPEQIGSRHYIGPGGRPASQEVRARWHVWFEFDQDLKLRSLEVELVATRGD